jgi:hypothetical protein
MKLLATLFLFIGIILVIYGVYENKIQKLKEKVKIEYRFIPRSYYDEQIFTNNFESKFQNIFENNNIQQQQENINTNTVS